MSSFISLLYLGVKMSKIIRYTCQDDGMAFLTLANPPVNALSSQMVHSINDVLDQISSSEETVRALIISSSERHFCAGLDLKEQINLEIEKAQEVVESIQACFTRIARLPFPVIAAINGVALGGGAELALCCDFRVMEESALIGFPETRLGMIPGAGGTQRLTRLVGPAKAKFWIFSGEQFDSEDALTDGVVDFIVDDGTALESAIEMADDFILNSPIGISAAKHAIDSGSDLPLPDGLRIELEEFRRTITSADREEGIRAFLERREPDWRGE